MRSMVWILMAFALIAASAGAGASEAPKLNVVTTLSDYRVIAQAIGGDRITATSIVLGDQDAHFIRPKPSFVDRVRRADLLIATGLDLELWLPTVVDKSANRKVRSGEPGYVAAAQGMHLLEKPAVMSRVEGGLHIHGNPHVTCSPINMRVAARNIATGLIKNDPNGKAYYERNLKAFTDELDRRLFGEELVTLLGGDTLCSLAEKGTLIEFLEQNDYEGEPLIDKLGGWMEQMLPLRGTPIVTYHKNWIYFIRLFGLEEAGTVEPKPGIPPSPKHVAELLQTMKDRQVKIIWAANYFDEHKVQATASKAGAVPVIVPLYVEGVPEATDYFALMDYWVDHMLAAAKEAGILTD
jgi:zinc/manganese transport system substrate-binding protein